MMNFFDDFMIMGSKNYFISPISREMLATISFANSNNVNRLVLSPLINHDDI